MIKSRFSFFSPPIHPEGEKRHVPMEHTWANHQVLITSLESNVLPRVCMCNKCVVCAVVLFSLLARSSTFFPGATCRRLEPSPEVCRRLLCRSNLDRKTQTHGARQKKSQAFPWHLYTFFLLIILAAAAPQPARSGPRCAARPFIWRGGVVVYYSWAARCEPRVIWQK